jgi:predicted aspartyl protease
LQELLLFICLLVTVVSDNQVAVANDSAQEIYAVTGYPTERELYGRLMVGVHVNGKGPFPFIVDTGASRTVIYRSLTAIMDLQSLPLKSRRIITVNGYRRAQIYPIKDIYTLGRTLKLADTVALPDILGSNAKGLIGVDLLAGRTLLVRPRHALAQLLDDFEPDEASGWGTAQGRPVAYGSVALMIEIAGISVPVIIDTGASDTVINKAGADVLKRASSEIRSVKTTAVVGRGHISAGEKLILPRFMLAGRNFENTDIFVADTPIFTLMGAAKVPAIILGMNVLKQQDFAIDFKNWRLYLRATKIAEPSLAPIAADP